MTKINELQENIVDDIISLLYSGKSEIGIKAPTGSGKTHMMAMLMDKLLQESESYIFVVSSLSKGDLAEQCYHSFVKNSDYCFKSLRPYLISTGNENSKNTEYGIQIDWGYNVYVLPTNQYTSASRIHRERSFLSFILKCKEENKKIILIRDESHIATNNLNSIKEYFSKTINFSATPKGDKYDLVLSEKEAIEVKLIKSIEYIDNKNDELEEGLTRALKHFKEEIKPLYEQYDIVPAFIVQIDNKDKGEREFNTIIKVVENQGLQWASFMDSDKNYETNNALTKSKNKKIWRELIKQSNYPIDVIIFKMVITEGFDIPRACVLYQVRDTQSKTLDEQVIGRVRRNPYLLNFDKLDAKTQEHFSKAYVYGVKPENIENKGKREIRLRGESVLHQTNEIIKEFGPFRSISLKEVAVKDIDIIPCIKKNVANRNSFEGNRNIFDAYRELSKCDSVVKRKLREYVTDSGKWFEFVDSLEEIKEEVKSVVEDYDQYGEMMEISEGLRNNLYSFMDLKGESFNCDNCIWTDDDSDKLLYDSNAELEWFKILNKLKSKCCKSVCIDDAEVFLFGKNYVDNDSNIKFDYYHKAKHTSYPDFIFKDKKDKIHIFEVKSVNGGSNVDFDTKRYKEKIEKLGKAYRYASKKTGYVFYIPVKKDNDWTIWRYEDGVKFDAMNEAQFKEYLENRVKRSRG